MPFGNVVLSALLLSASHSLLAALCRSALIEELLVLVRVVNG